MAAEILIGKTGSATYTLKGMWVYRDIGNGRPYRYDTLEGFAQEWDAGAFGGSCVTPKPAESSLIVL
jgi:hypothetical protein